MGAVLPTGPPFTAPLALGLALLGCSASHSIVDAGTTVTTVATCDSAFDAFYASHWDGHRDTTIACSDFDVCWRCPTQLSCVDGLVRAFAGSEPCDAGPIVHAPSVDAGSDAAIDGGDPRIDDAGVVASCAAAIEAVSGEAGVIPYCFGPCDTGIACTGYGGCFVCPYFVECPAGVVVVHATGVRCDAGP